MGANSDIEWCHHTVNFWWGCEKVSAACVHCYAEVLARVFSKGRATWGAGGARWIRYEEAGRELHRLARAAKRRGRRERVFINSMSDTFDPRADLEFARQWLWSRIMEVGYALDVIVLTKRPELIPSMVPADWMNHWPAWVWIGTTVEDQPQADKRIRELTKIPARVRFLSAEPLLGPITLPIGQVMTGFPRHITAAGHAVGAPLGIHWVICGGESGAGARPIHPAWARALRAQCAAAGVPFFFKQWGEWIPVDQSIAGQKMSPSDAFPGAKSTVLQLDGRQEFAFPPGAMTCLRVGKKPAGRLLDGIEHHAFPVPA